MDQSSLCVSGFVDPDQHTQAETGLARITPTIDSKQVCERYESSQFSNDIRLDGSGQ